MKEKSVAVPLRMTGKLCPAIVAVCFIYLNKLNIIILQHMYTHVQRLRMDISRFTALYKCSYYIIMLHQTYVTKDDHLDLLIDH